MSARCGGDVRRGKVRRLRARDGDLCTLCGCLIDFSLRPNDPGAVSLDHVVPRVHGGGSRVSNLRLAHRACNSRRGSSPDRIPQTEPVPEHELSERYAG